MKTTKKANKAALVIKKIAGKMADVSCGAASFWGIHQIKEPKVRKWKCVKTGLFCTFDKFRAWNLHVVPNHLTGFMKFVKMCKTAFKTASYDIIFSDINSNGRYDFGVKW